MALSDICITHKLCFLGDRLGNTVCFTYKFSTSVVEYAIVGHNVSQNIIYFTAHLLNLLSNH